MKNSTRYTYSNITIACLGIISKYKLEKKKIDYIIGIGRGGLIPATIIAYQLDKPVLNYGISSYKGKDKSKLNVYQDVDFCMFNRDKTILLVDDLTDTAETLIHAREHFSWAVKKVYTTTLYVKDLSVIDPDFYYEKVDSKLWIEFPWDPTI